MAKLLERVGSDGGQALTKQLDEVVRHLVVTSHNGSLVLCT
jgi:hypothetical protein